MIFGHAFLNRRRIRLVRQEATAACDSGGVLMDAAPNRYPSQGQRRMEPGLATAPLSTRLRFGRTRPAAEHPAEAVLGFPLSQPGSVARHIECPPGGPGSGIEEDGPPPPQGRPLDLEALAAQWWLAFEAAERAIDASAHLIASGALLERKRHLGEQHARMAQLLKGLARDDRLTSPLIRWLGGPRITRRVLGLPDTVTACVFDLDGVLTTSQQVHVEAWAEALDDFLFERSERSGRAFAPFDRRREYNLWVAGRPRLEGLRAFLTSRGIHLPEGAPEDPPDAETVQGLANRKNALLRGRLANEGVDAFAGSRSYLEAARVFGMRRAVVSASENTAAILERAGLAHLIERRVDGEAIATERLRAKPSPDTLVAACARLGVAPARSAAFESSRAGIAAARAAEFAVVVGVNRHGQASALRSDEADLVVNDLAELLTLDRAVPRRRLTEANE